MTCPICDQKAINCDCTDIERRQHSEIADLEELVESLRLTDAERAAIGRLLGVIGPCDDAATLLGLLERTDHA